MDAEAVTPGAIASQTATDSASSAATVRRRLRRSQNPVLAALDNGGELFQRRVRDVLVGSVAILAPLVAVNLWVTVVAFDRFDPEDSFFPGVSSSTSTGVEDVAVWTALVFASIATAIVGHFLAQLLLADRFRSGITLSAALATTGRRLPSIGLVWLLGHWWQPLLAWWVVAVDTDDLSGVVFFVGMLSWFASNATLYAIPAMVGEQLGPVAALRRSWRLMRLRFGAGFLFLLLATVISALFLTGAATLAPLLEANGFVDFGGVAWLVQGVLVQLGVLLIVPLVSLGTAQLYVEVRMVAEGLDLAIDADAAFGTSIQEGVASG